ncbi:MAG: amidohydrolase family protein [Gemmatimonadota bacterium]
MPDSRPPVDRSASHLTRRQLLTGAGAALGAGLLLPDPLAAGISGLARTSPANAAGRGANDHVVFTHTTVVTGDPNRAQLKDVALAVEGGVVAAIGPTDDVVARFPGAEVIDGRNKAVLPGVINCHAHLSAAIARGFNEDFGFPNRADLPVSPGGRLLSEEERTLMSVMAALHSIRTGTTTVVEYTGGIAPEAAELARTGLRWVFAEGVNDRVGGTVMSPERLAETSTPEFSAEMREEGLQRIEDLYSQWHGANDGRIQVFPAVVHTENASPELLRAIREFAEQRDLGYTIHMNQTHAEIEYMTRYHGVRPAEYLYQHDFLGPRLFAAHARYVDQNEIDLLAQTDTIISHQASMAANRGVSPPIPALREAGCRICLGTDNNNNDMFAVMKVALLTERIRRNDEHPGLLPQPEDILRDAAHNGAHAIRQPSQLGLLEVGRKADLIVLDTLQPHLVPSGRILSAWLHNGGPSDVESVMVDGEFIMRDHRILTVDEESLVAEANRVGRRVWEQVESGGPVEPPGRTNWR